MTLGFGCPFSVNRLACRCSSTAIPLKEGNPRNRFPPPSVHHFEGVKPVGHGDGDVLEVLRVPGLRHFIQALQSVLLRSHGPWGMPGIRPLQQLRSLGFPQVSSLPIQQGSVLWWLLCDQSSPLRCSEEVSSGVSG